MATYWLGAGGNDANDGTSYANRKATWAAALALITSKGDVLNVVGTVEMDNTPYTMDGDVLTSLPGTSFLDPAFTIRGTDSDGQPAQATALATSQALWPPMPSAMMNICFRAFTWSASSF